jgi:hypothetical protein
VTAPTEFGVRGYSPCREFGFFFTDREAAESKARELRERGFLAAIEALPPPIDVTEFQEAIDDVHHPS